MFDQYNRLLDVFNTDNKAQSTPSATNKNQKNNASQKQSVESSSSGKSKHTNELSPSKLSQNVLAVRKQNQNKPQEERINETEKEKRKVEAAMRNEKKSNLGIANPNNKKLSKIKDERSNKDYEDESKNSLEKEKKRLTSNEYIQEIFAREDEFESVLNYEDTNSKERSSATNNTNNRRLNLVRPNASRENHFNRNEDNLNNPDYYDDDDDDEIAADNFNSRTNNEQQFSKANRHKKMSYINRDEQIRGAVKSKIESEPDRLKQISRKSKETVNNASKNRFKKNHVIEQDPDQNLTENDVDSIISESEYIKNEYKYNKQNHLTQQKNEKSKLNRMALQQQKETKSKKKHMDLKNLPVARAFEGSDSGEDLELINTSERKYEQALQTLVLNEVNKQSKRNYHRSVHNPNANKKSKLYGIMHRQTKLDENEETSLEDTIVRIKDDPASEEHIIDQIEDEYTVNDDQDSTIIESFHDSFIEKKIYKNNDKRFVFKLFVCFFFIQ
jgi:hypothetical protein